MTHLLPKLMMTPSINYLPPFVKKALTRRVINPDFQPEFREYYFRIERLIDKIVGLSSKGRVYFLLGSGTLPLEAAIINFTRAGEKTLVLSNGFFGNYIAWLLRIHERKPIVHKIGINDAITISNTEDVLDNIDSNKIFMVHCETSTGVCNDVKSIAKKASVNDKMLIVDAVSSVGAIDIQMDQWGIDILVGVGHKALNTPPGISFLAVREKALNKMNNDVSIFYQNLGLWNDFFGGKGYPPYTISPQLLVALESSLNEMEREGLKNVYLRHRRISELLFDASLAMGFKPVPKDKMHSCPTVTVLKPPIGVTAQELFVNLLEKHSILIGKGVNEDSNELIRIGHMGYYARKKYVARVINALVIELSHKKLVSKRDVKDVKKLFAKY